MPAILGPGMCFGMTGGRASIVATTTGGNAVMLPQNAAQVPADMPSWSLTQPSHLPDMGISFVTPVAISTAIAEAWKPWAVSPMARDRAIKTATIRRVFSDMELKLTAGIGKYQRR